MYKLGKKQQIIVAKKSWFIGKVLMNLCIFFLTYWYISALFCHALGGIYKTEALVIQ